MCSQVRLPDASLFPLLSIDPAAPLDDLEPLARLIPAGVRVVAIGESAHAAHEFYTLRHRLVRFLVERMKFTAVAWESGFPEAFLVDEYIHGQMEDRSRAQIDGMTMHMGRCEEFGRLLDWLRSYNAVHDSGSPRSGAVRFYGLDLPEGAMHPMFAAIGPYVETVDPGFAARLKRLRELAAVYGASIGKSGKSAASGGKLSMAGAATLREYMAMPAVDRNELTCLLADLGARFDALQRVFVERSDAERYDVARQQLRVAAQLDLQLRAVAALMTGDTAACEANIRDATMADTVEWILGREQRIAILAHNGHIQKTPIATSTGNAVGVDTLGVHLARRLGEQYMAIGTTCGSGEMVAMRTVPGPNGSYDSELYIRNLPPVEADTIDSVLDANVSQPTLVDLRTLDPPSAAMIDAAQRMRTQDQALSINVRQAFDMLIHVPRISIWTSETNAWLPDERGEKLASGMGQ